MTRNLRRNTFDRDTQRGQAGRNARTLLPLLGERRRRAENEPARAEETEDNFIGNARIKAHAAVKATGLPALSDDSGIEVEALNGCARCLHGRLGRNAQWS